MKTAPFVYAPPQATALPARLPYHDNTDCPDGQQLRQSGRWRPYEPASIAETRPRCPLCLALDRA